MSTPLAEIDEGLWEQYLTELRILGEDNGVEVHPSIKDFYVWMDDKDIDWNYNEGY